MRMKEELPLEFAPQEFGELKKRFPAALRRTWDMSKPIDIASALAVRRDHVFDCTDGMRLMVSKEIIDGRSVVHASASLQVPGAALNELALVRPRAWRVAAFRLMAKRRLELISGLPVDGHVLTETQIDGVFHFVLAESFMRKLNWGAGQVH